MRWCSDGFEISCENGERVRIAFALDCCDREAMSWVATTGGIDGNMVRDLMVEAIETRFGRELPNQPIEWRTDNGSPYIARDTRGFAREIGLVPLTTAIKSPQSNGMAESFVRTFKRDYAARMDLTDDATLMRQLHSAFEHYNNVRLHSAIGYIAPADYLAGRSAEIWATSDQKLEAAREQRRLKRQAARSEVAARTTHSRPSLT